LFSEKARTAMPPSAAAVPAEWIMMVIFMERLGGDRLLSRFFASTRAKLREIGERFGVRHLVNLTGYPLR
jgi:hypothetical protein